MNVKKVAMWTAGIFLAVILMGALLGSCAGPSNAMSGQPGQNGSGGPGYQDNSSNGWLWGLGGLAAGYGIGKYFNRNKSTTQSPQQKSVTPPPIQQPDKKVTQPNPGSNKPKTEYKPSAPAPKTKKKR